MTLTRFGSRVVGDAQVEAERELVQGGGHLFGPRVVGAQVEAEKPATAEDAFLDSVVADPAKLDQVTSLEVLEGLLQREQAGRNRAVVLEAIVNRQLDIERAGSLTVNDLRKALADGPEFLDEAIRREFTRPRVRKEALRLFIEVEGQREGGARPDVVARLEKALV